MTAGGRMAIPRILNDSVKISFRMERADRDYLDALAKRRSLSGRSEALRGMIAEQRLKQTRVEAAVATTAALEIKLLTAYGRRILADRNRDSEKEKE